TSYYCINIISSYSFVDTDGGPTYIYTLSLHDALPISGAATRVCPSEKTSGSVLGGDSTGAGAGTAPVTIKHYLTGYAPGLGCTRSEEHTSELQSRENLVCRLLLEKKKK